MKLFPLHLIPNDTKIDFLRLRWPAIMLSVVLALVAIGAIATKGFNYALDFTGGVGVELHFQQAPGVDAVRERLAAAGFESAQVQTYGAGTDMLVRLQDNGEHAEKTGAFGAQAAGGESAAAGIAQQIAKAASTTGNTAEVRSSSVISAQVGRDLAKNAAMAMAFVIIGFMAYIAFRFEWKFAVAAIICTLHDVLVVAGFFALTQREFDLTLMAGLLTVMGFSINDTIVVFDRVRENFRTMRADPLTILNASVNQTLSRTIITSFVAFLTGVALYMYGGGSLEGMAVSQMMGIVIGTLSSIFVACNLLTVGPLKVTKQDLMPKSRDDAALARRP